MKIPQPIAAFIHATNTHNTDQFLAALTDTAVISDEGQDYRGIAAIKEWSDEKLIGAKVTLEPIKTVERNGWTIVTVRSMETSTKPDFLTHSTWIFTSLSIRIKSLH